MFSFCFLIAIICPPLADSPYGLITYSNTSPYLIRAQARYTITCPPGQETRGISIFRVCTGDGRSTVGVWDGAAPVCAGLRCTDNIPYCCSFSIIQVNQSFCRVKE